MFQKNLLGSPFSWALKRGFDKSLESRFSRCLVGNGNFIPHQLDSQANNVRNNSHVKYIAGNKKITDVEIGIVNYAATSTAESSTTQNCDIKVGIYYNKVYYPATYVGNTTSVLNAGETRMIWKVPNLVLDPNVKRRFRVVIRLVGPVGTFSYPRNTTSWSLFGEAVVLGTDTGVDFCDGLMANGAEATAVVTGNNITGGTVTDGGVNYTTSPTVYAYEMYQDQLYVKSIGTGSRTGSAITGITITDGTPPAGLPAWVSPTLVIAYGSAHAGPANAIAGFTSSFITGKIKGKRKGVGISGDSLARGNGLTDPPDVNMNQGIYEIGLQNKVGIFNMAIGSGTAQAQSNWSANYPKTFDNLQYLVDQGCVTDVIQAILTNDIRNGGQTLATYRTRYNTLKAKFVSMGLKIKTATVPSRTTNSAPYQTPITADFANGAVYSQINDEIRSGSITNDTGYIDAQTIFSNPDNREQWAQDLGTITRDGTHFSNAAYGYAARNATFLSYFANLVN